ncbi:hypothetical protein [Streptomyces tsukubensis]|uniref:hypothetical protein n=1 Tax=Streptomyces tsukubensis TaxID=83656 RepID=UPI00344C7E0F
MHVEILDDDGNGVEVEARAGSPESAGEVRVYASATHMDDRRGAVCSRRFYSPSQARELANALLHAADVVESGVSEEARLRLELAAVDDALRKAGIDYPLGARGVRDLATLLQAAREDRGAADVP